MAERRIVNASPLIFLSKAGLLDVLREGDYEVQVPDAVLTEIDAIGVDNVTSEAIRAASWLVVVPTPPTPPGLRRWALGDGESAVLAVALATPGAEAILDDLPARRCAAALGIPHRGTLGMLLVARDAGMIPDVRPVLNLLVQSGMYLSATVRERFLAMADERPEDPGAEHGPESRD